MEEKPIQSHIRLSEVNKKCFLCGNPDRVVKIANYLTDAEKVAENRGLITYNGYTPDNQVPVSIITTGMGCPSTGIVLEEVYQAGGKILIRIGSCGALQSGIKVGDVIIPYAAIRDERTSLSLAPIEFPAAASPEIFLALCKSADSQGFTYYPGIVWTSDVFYNPDPNHYKIWANAGANSVEMESSLLFTFGTVKRLKIGTILVVDGNLADGSQNIGDRVKENKILFDNGTDSMIKCAIHTIENF